MSKRIYNFGAGPAMLPESILKQAQAELLNWHGLGVSILELGHRTSQFIDLLLHAEQSLRTLLAIPPNYHVLFLGGAARTQFSMIPLNFLAPDEEAAYLVTGIWSQMALKEAQKLKKASSVFGDGEGPFLSVPHLNDWEIKNHPSYFYYTPNETVNGIRVPFVPQTGNIPLIADMTSCLLSEPIDVSQYGLIFAGAQKNIANAGLTLVIIRDDLLKKTPYPTVPSMLDYKIQVENNSLYATPPVFNCYLADKMFDWIKEHGGVDALYQQNLLKSNKLYDYLDSTDCYITKVAKEARSLLNVCFSLKKPGLEHKFLVMAEAQGLYALKGHRFAGGLRASLYNAMPVSGVDALIKFMQQFAKDECL